MDTYQYRREDDGQVIEVDFETNMTMDVLGCIVLPDGVTARRVRDRDRTSRSKATQELEKPIVSDSLGFIAEQLADFELDRVKNGFTGVEFVRDPHVPEFMQVKVSSASEWRRYMKHRGYCDKNSRNGSGASVSQKELDDLRVAMLKKYPEVNRQFASVDVR